MRSGAVERDAEGELTIPEPGDTTQAEVDDDPSVAAPSPRAGADVGAREPSGV